MQRYGLASLVKIGLCALLALGAVSQLQADDAKVNPVGKWSWTGPGRNGNPGRTQTLTLKMDGDKLVGTMTGMGRGRQNADGGAPATPPPGMKLNDLKLVGDTITFNVSRPGRGGGDPVVVKYTGKISGDSIKFKSEVPVEGQDPRVNEFEAKRATDKPAAPAADAK